MLEGELAHMSFLKGNDMSVFTTDTGMVASSLFLFRLPQRMAGAHTVLFVNHVLEENRGIVREAFWER